MASDRREDPDRFRLEDEAARPDVVRPAPRPPGAGADPAPRPRHEPRYDEAGRPVVSEETVSERRDPRVRDRSRPGALPDPPGWPLEALLFPFRGRGSLGLLGVALTFAAADALTVVNAFLGALVKVPLYVGLLRWQVRTVARTATGDDVPPRPFVAADFETDGLRDLFGMVLRLGLYVLPAAFLFARPWLATPDHPDHSAAEWIGIAGLLALAFLLAPVLLLGAGLGWKGIAWPWNAVSWLARGLVPCAATGAGWAACVAAERLVLAWEVRPILPAIAAYGALRAVVTGLTLVGARGLGVLARRFELAGAEAS
jgi:hypothetical protein